MRPISLILLSFVLITQLFLSGCSGCSENDGQLSLGTNNGNTDGTGTDSITAEVTLLSEPAGTYLFYYATLVEDVTTTGVGAVDVTDPAAPRNVAAVKGPAYGVRAITNGTYASGTISSAWQQTAVFQANDKLYKMTAAEGGALTVSQLSSAALSENIINTKVASDYSNHADSAYLYEQSGSWFLVKQGATSSTAPTNAQEPVSALYDNTTGAIRGWLAIDGATLKYYDSNFTIVDSNVASFSSRVTALNNGQEGYVVLLIDDLVYVFDGGVTPSLSSALFNLNGATFLDNLSDGNHVYFLSRGTDSKVYLYRVTAVGTPIVEEIALSDGILTAQQYPHIYLDYTNNYVIYGWGTETTNSLFTSTLNRIDKVSLQVFPAIIDEEGSLFNFETAGVMIFYNTIYADGTPNASVIREDQSPFVPVNNANWYGHAVSRSAQAGAPFKPVKKFLLTQYSQSDIFASEDIRVYTNADVTITEGTFNLVGAIPADVSALTFGGFGDYLLGVGPVPTDNGKHDLFYVDTTVSASTGDVVHRLTTTSNASENLLH